MTSNEWDGIERRSNRSDELHKEHHEFIKALIEKEHRKQELWEKIQTNVGSWALIAIITFIALSSWDSVVHYLRGRP